MRFLALNEVGGEPSRFGIPLAEFHAENAARAKAWPQAITTTATHDTKRGEDARARLIALSEAPDLWAQVLAAWKAEARGVAKPDSNDQYLFLQAIIGVWPIELLEHDDPAVLAALRERLAAYVPKALREGKRRSKWIEPNEGYENATIELLDRLLADDSTFIARVRPILRDLAKRGMLNSLGRTVLKCTLPGVPDFYQGTALWDFSLVDPDNRRPVDYSERAQIAAGSESLQALLQSWQNGAIKLRVAADLLNDRRDNAVFYAKADYAPLTVTGGRWSKLVAFARRFGTKRLVVLVPRLAGGGSATSVLPVGTAYWGGTNVDLPAGQWRDVLSGNAIVSNGTVAVGTILESLPFAVMRLTE